MGKVILFFSFCVLLLNAQEVSTVEKHQLHKACLACHTEQQIPSALIYRRYLMKYSTFDRIEKAMFSYIQKPEQAYSIMPAQFFLKFPMKETSILDEDTLKKMIKNYLNTFDVKKKFILSE